MQYPYCAENDVPQNGTKHDQMRVKTGRQKSSVSLITDDLIAKSRSRKEIRPDGLPTTHALTGLVVCRKRHMGGPVVQKKPQSDDSKGLLS